jgi:hypothetical protein
MRSTALSDQSVPGEETQSEPFRLIGNSRGSGMILHLLKEGITGNWMEAKFSGIEYDNHPTSPLLLGGTTM